MRVRAIVVAVVAVAVSVAGCGDDSEPESEPQDEIQVAAATASAEDIAAIERLYQYLTQANAAGQSDWLTAIAVSNYMVANGTYTPAECITAARKELGILIGARVAYAPRTDTIVSRAGDVQRELGTIPDGRLYSTTLEVSIGPPDPSVPLARVTVSEDVVVLPNGDAKTFSTCA